MVGFPAFFLIWAEEVLRWSVPDLHIVMCEWLEEYEEKGVLMVPRGHAKSTILAVYCAWRWACDPTHRILVQGADDRLAYKLSRDAQSVVRRHPLCGHLLPIRGGVEFWWVNGATDDRNASFAGSGVLSNVTGGRADEIINDDSEVQKNVLTPDAREKLRSKLSEQTHILVPNGRKLFVGTPHTHASIYSEEIEAGTNTLKIPLYRSAQRYPAKEASEATRFKCSFRPEVVFLGVHKYSRLLQEGIDYKWNAGHVVFSAPPGDLLDLYADPAWPERFTRDVVEKRRKEAKTINEWDSQYMLDAKPIHDVRLDPERIIPYDLEPEIKYANGECAMFLGGTRMVGASAYWDVSLGKIKSDASAFSLVFTDAAGRLYWHVCEPLQGDADQQCKQIRKFVDQYELTRVVVEVNGPGGFVPPILRKHLRGSGCGVSEEFSKVEKNKRILDAFEAPLSSRFLWAHVSVLDGPMWEQMQDWNPTVKDQPDDYLDSGAGAISQTPVRIGNSNAKILHQTQRNNWAPGHGTFEVSVD